jgi:hypothetical protein
MSELDKLKKENKKLKALLRDAVELLNKYKDVLKRTGKAGAEEKKGRKEKKNKKDKKTKGDKKNKTE